MVAKLYESGSAYVVADLSIGKRSDILDYEMMTNIARGRIGLSDVSLTHPTDGKNLKVVSLDNLLDNQWRHFVD